MTFNHDAFPTCSMQEMLEEASAGTGFSPAEMEALLNCELDTDQLIIYITAVASKRMN